MFGACRLVNDASTLVAHLPGRKLQAPGRKDVKRVARQGNPKLVSTLARQLETLRSSLQMQYKTAGSRSFSLGRVQR